MWSYRVIPVPGGPTSRTPAGDLAPRSKNFLGFFRNCTSSTISAFTWSMPAMSAKVIRESLLVIISSRAPPNSLQQRQSVTFCTCLNCLGSSGLAQQLLQQPVFICLFCSGLHLGNQEQSAHTCNRSSRRLLEVVKVAGVGRIFSKVLSGFAQEMVDKIVSHKQAIAVAKETAMVHQSVFAQQQSFVTGSSSPTSSPGGPAHGRLGLQLDTGVARVLDLQGWKLGCCCLVMNGCWAKIFWWLLEMRCYSSIRSQPTSASPSTLLLSTCSYVLSAACLHAKFVNLLEVHDGTACLQQHSNRASSPGTRLQQG